MQGGYLVKIGYRGQVVVRYAVSKYKYFYCSESCLDDQIYIYTMKFRDKEKLWLSIVKRESLKQGMQFKSHFAYQVKNDLFISAAYDVHMNADTLSVRVKFKPFQLDELLWEMMREEGNSQKPVSFREQAAFQADGYLFHAVKITISNLEDPEAEIAEMTTGIHEQLQLASSQTINDYINYIAEDDSYAIDLVLAFIYLEKEDLALQKIDDFRRRKVRPRLSFGSAGDFFDLADAYIRKKQQKPTLGNKLLSLLKIR